ncbi:cation transport ATPase [Lacticaseibacillus paracasei subsp. paracasei CNCM I-4270]|uniref:Cation transport ATPase n=1 Tax=Lacticaseibacillus paracasei subsp. paracasei CNCM I-4270 TaxID=1256202 RepID=A0A8E0IN62_LACPA|nr:cation transport ATPase [Lacticaseibacillus paracasei subsp. paracasei CNCM I-4270]
MKNEKETRRKFATDPVPDLMTDLHTTSTGLTQKEATDRLEKYGENVITREKQQSQLLIFLKNFTSVMAILLWVSGFVAILSGTLELGIAIWLVNIINGVFSYWQEHEAQKATDSLMKMLPAYTQVYRDGKLQQINATKMVPGDVFNLQAGNAVPVDARLIKATSVQVDQSALTGESVPESKKSCL